MILMEVTPYPIQQVEEAVHAQEEHVVRGEALAFTHLLQDEELWNNRHRLKVNGESPKPFRRLGMVLVHGETEEQTRNDEVRRGESVCIGAVRAALRLFVPDSPHNDE